MSGVLDVSEGFGITVELPWGLWWGFLGITVEFFWDIYTVSLKGHKPVLLPGPRERTELSLREKAKGWGGQRRCSLTEEGDRLTWQGREACSTPPWYSQTLTDSLIC